MTTIVEDHGYPLISIGPETDPLELDDEGTVLHRLAAMPPPSAHALESGARRDVVALEDARIGVAHAVEQLIRRAVRRLRRALA